MSEVVCGAPIAIPVFRMRATLTCRDLGSPAHRAAERLSELGAPSDQIAAALGLRIDQAQNLLGQLAGTGGQGVREIRVWIDIAHSAVLTAREGLDLIPGARQRDLALLSVLPPKPSDLASEAFALAASTLSGRSARIVVDEVRALEPDRQHGSPRFHHVLHLSRTDLVIYEDRTFEVHWHDVADEQLTAVAVDLLTDQIIGLDWEALSPLVGEQERTEALGRVGITLRDAYPVDLDPGTIHDRALELVHSAERQVVLAIEAPLRRLPDWLDPALEAASNRDVEVHLLLSDTSKWDEGQAARWKPARFSELPAAVLLVRDADRALVHSAATAFGAEASLTGLRSQAALEIHDAHAVRKLLERMSLPSPTVERRGPHRPLEDLATEELGKAVAHQQHHLGELSAAITHDDVAAFVDQLTRNHVRSRDKRRVGQVAAGVAWERAVHTVCSQLAAKHAQLAVDAFRWAPPEGGMDLDIILRDLETETWWVLDAKFDSPAGRHVAQTLLQFRIARDHGLIPDGWVVRALIVHPPPARATPELTNDSRVRRATLDRLDEALGLV